MAMEIKLTQPAWLELQQKASTQTWKDDLKSLFLEAKNRFPDVVWETGAYASNNWESSGEAIWGHKAIVHARSNPRMQALYMPSSGQVCPHIYPGYSHFVDDLRYLYTAESALNDEAGLDLDRLREDLTFMQKCRRYADVQISVDHQEDGPTVFLSHRFILSSRSPYFRTVLVQSDGKNAGSLDDPLMISLPPIFTPLSFRLILGYLYTGRVEFAHEDYNLSAAFSTFRGSRYLAIPALEELIRAQMVVEMLHGLFEAHLSDVAYEEHSEGKWSTMLTLGCRCPRCTHHAPRVLQFALEHDIKNNILERGARRALVGLFGEGWCTAEFSALPASIRHSIVTNVQEIITPSNVFPLLFAAENALRKLDSPPSQQLGSLNVARNMIVSVRTTVGRMLCANSQACFEGEVWGDIMKNDHRGVKTELGHHPVVQVGWVMEALIRDVRREEINSVYQALIVAKNLPTQSGHSPLLSSSIIVQIERAQELLEMMRFSTIPIPSPPELPVTVRRQRSQKPLMARLVSGGSQWLLRKISVVKKPRGPALQRCAARLDAAQSYTSILNGCVSLPDNNLSIKEPIDATYRHVAHPALNIPYRQYATLSLSSYMSLHSIDIEEPGSNTIDASYDRHAASHPSTSSNLPLQDSISSVEKSTEPAWRTCDVASEVSYSTGLDALQSASTFLYCKPVPPEDSEKPIDPKYNSLGNAHEVSDEESDTWSRCSYVSLQDSVPSIDVEELNEAAYNAYGDAFEPLYIAGSDGPQPTPLTKCPNFFQHDTKNLMVVTNHSSSDTLNVSYQQYAAPHLPRYSDLSSQDITPYIEEPVGTAYCAYNAPLKAFYVAGLDVPRPASSFLYPKVSRQKIEELMFPKYHSSDGALDVLYEECASSSTPIYSFVSPQSYIKEPTDTAYCSYDSSLKTLYTAGLDIPQPASSFLYPKVSLQDIEEPLVGASHSDAAALDVFYEQYAASIPPPYAYIPCQDSNIPVEEPTERTYHANDVALESPYVAGIDVPRPASLFLYPKVSGRDIEEPMQPKYNSSDNALDVLYQEHSPSFASAQFFISPEDIASYPEQRTEITHPAYDVPLDLEVPCITGLNVPPPASLFPYPMVSPQDIIGAPNHSGSAAPDVLYEQYTASLPPPYAYIPSYQDGVLSIEEPTELTYYAYDVARRVPCDAGTNVLQPSGTPQVIEESLDTNTSYHPDFGALDISYEQCDALPPPPYSYPSRQNSVLFIEEPTATTSHTNFTAVEVPYEKSATSSLYSYVSSQDCILSIEDPMDAAYYLYRRCGPAINNPDDITLYSNASSRTTSSDYGVFYTRMAISQETIQDQDSVRFINSTVGPSAWKGRL